MKKLLLSILLMTTVGCVSNYGTYARSVQEDLKSLRPMVESYVNKDTRLSGADRKARLSVLDELDKKTAVAIEETK